jgi:acyl-CoA dehydrogenase
MSDTEESTALTDTVTRFARTEIAPHVDAWDAAGEFPRTLYRRAADLGLLGLGYPEQYGGTPASYALRLPLWRALSRHGASGGVLASLLSHNIGLPPVLAHGSEAVRAEVVPPVLAGERIAALAITEPGGGSDVAQLKTTARLEGDEYIVNGEKVFITSGMRADWITVAVRTGEPGKDYVPPRSPAAHGSLPPEGALAALGRPGGGKGASGISMLLVPGHSAGLSRNKLDKMGWLCSDTAHLRFDNVRVPARYLLGEEGAGFRIIMSNFNAERFGLAASVCRSLLRRSPGLGAPAQDLWCSAGGAPGHPPQAHGHADANPIDSRMVRGRGCAGRCGPHRRGMGRAHLPAEKPRHANHAVLR